MRIARSQSQDGAVTPSALDYLGQIPDHYHFTHQHSRRAPLGIYNVSFELLVADFSKLLDEYFKTRELVGDKSPDVPDGEEYYGGILKAQKDLIHSLQSHVDDCYSILASLVDPKTVPANLVRERFTERWLRGLSFPTLNQFRQAISQYRDNHLAHLVNGLKHRQNRLRGIFFHSPREVRLGYYLEEPDMEGVPGPSFNLHEEGNSALSFAKDILLNLYHVYYISEMLVEAVKGALQHYHSFSLCPQKLGAENEKWLDVIRQASRIAPLVFPSELDKPFPYFSFTEDEHDKSLVLMYPVTLIPLRFPQGMKMHVIFRADGVSKSFRIPYLKPSKYGRVR